MALDGGIDLHANNSVVVLLDEQDRVVYQKRLPNALEHILEPLAPYRAAIRGSWSSRPTIGTGWWMG